MVQSVALLSWASLHHPLTAVLFSGFIFLVAAVLKGVAGVSHFSFFPRFLFNSIHVKSEVSKDEILS